jgi:arabinofuranosyltransferase
LRRNRGSWLVAVPTAVLFVGAWQRRWMADDAFIHLRVVEQLLHGNGPVFNAGERVEASTSPLWVVVLAVLSAPRVIGPERLAVGLALLSTIGGVLLAARGSRSLWHGGTDRGGRWLLPVGALILAVLPPMWDFGTSGLETGFGFLWLGGCFALLTRLLDPGRGWPAFRTLAFTAGLGPLIRPEFAVFSVAFLGAALILATGLSRRPRRFRMRLVATGMAVPAVYQLFRMGYYGALVPNTAFAKEASRAWWSQGFRYVGDFAGTYRIWVPLLAAAALVMVGARRGWLAGRQASVVLAAPILGGLAQALYITRVGGDFMHGRLLLPGLFAALMPVMVVPVRHAVQWVTTAAVAVWALVCGTQLRVPYVMTAEGLTDERVFYTVGTKRSNPVTAGDFVRHPFHEDAVEARRLRREGQRVVAWRPDYRAYGFSTAPLRADFAFPVAFSSDYVGVLGFVAGPDVYVADRMGLGDTVAARVEITGRGRPGHEKQLPMAWVLGRVADPAAPPPEGVSLAATEAARAALQCGDLAELQRATTGRLTPGRFLRNLGVALRLQNFRVDRDPLVAESELCGRPVRHGTAQHVVAQQHRHQQPHGLEPDPLGDGDGEVGRRE